MAKQWKWITAVILCLSALLLVSQWSQPQLVPGPEKLADVTPTPTPAPATPELSTPPTPPREYLELWVDSGQNLALSDKAQLSPEDKASCFERLDQEFRNPRTAFEHLRAARCDASLYATARNLYVAELKQARRRAEADVIRGFVTATYYGAGEHRLGLDFLCESYAGLPAVDHRFRFQAHAHLRRIAIEEGRHAAVAEAKKRSESCSRSDFAEVWAYVPLGAMEALHGAQKEIPYYGEFIYEREDAVGLRNLKERSEAGEKIPFIAHVLWLLGDLDAIHEQHPSFEGMEFVSLQEVHEFAADIEGDPRQKFAKLDEFLAKYPRSGWKELLARAVLKSVRDDIGEAEWLAAIGRYGLVNPNASAEVESEVVAEPSAEQPRAGSAEWIYEAVTEARRDATAFLEDGNVSRALALLDTASNSIARTAESVTGSDEDPAAELRGLAADIRSNLSDLDSLTPEQAIARGINIRDEMSWRTAAAGVFSAVAANSAATADQKARALFLRGRTLIAATNWSVDEAEEAFARIANEYPNHPLADDAMAEIGWIYLHKGKELDAIELLSDLVEQYPRANAADNALWLKAEALERLDRDAEANTVYAQIATGEVQARLTVLARDIVYNDVGTQRIAGWLDSSQDMALKHRPDLHSASCTRVREATPQASIGALKEGDKCEIGLSRRGPPNPLDLYWIENVRCVVQVTNGELSSDQPCAVQPAEPELGLALRRASDMGGLSLRIDGQRIVEGESGKSQWKERLLVAPGPDAEGAASRAGIRVGWALVSLCEEEVDPQRAGALGSPPVGSTCSAGFLAPGARPENPNANGKILIPLDRWNCTLKFEESKIAVLDECRRA